MSLTAREQKILEQIGRDLVSSDPDLASFLFGFTWLAADEALPDREQVSAGWRELIWPRRDPRRRLTEGMRAGARRPERSPRWQLMWPLLLWLMTSIALVVVALTVGHGAGNGTCTRLAPACAGQLPAFASTQGVSPRRAAASSHKAVWLGGLS